MCSVHARQLRLYLLFFLVSLVYLRWRFRRTVIARTRRWVCNVHSSLVATLFIVRCTFDEANLECAQNFFNLRDCYFCVVNRHSSANVRSANSQTCEMQPLWIDFISVPTHVIGPRKKCSAYSDFSSIFSSNFPISAHWHQLLLHKYQCHLNQRIPFVAYFN